ncbi:PQQ-dependent sugar dehydrogenase [Mesorhizobium loti]|uniref:Sorbosone dehydrogenase family protein n=1 Tax=Mesorhizobium loti R88b TaxID=935548 RepID=A0A6M7WG90_RHILI|nr:sorbosone dehydrogenase family protein [Mesorhizobium loti]QKD00836.1 sorbosone dehydrogenase family protein [Mesorhizobium loti R88b]
MIRIASVTAIPISILIASSAFAADQPVLKGPAAFGDWRADKPGVRRLIKPEDLPKPYVTKSASNSAGLADMPTGAKPQLPPGFSAELIASGIDNPRVVRVAPNGDLFVADSEANQIRVYRLAEGSAKPVENGVFAGNLNQPYGIAFYPPGDDPQWVYVANSDSIVRFAYRKGDLKASGEPETIVDNIPSNHHWTRDIVFSRDGKTLYLSVGSGSNVAEDMGKAPDGGLDAWLKSKPLGATWGSEDGRADVLAFDPDGKNGRIVATGLRNCSGMTIQPATGALWCVVNERDALGDNVPSEYATSIREGAFYGWPWYYIGNHEDPRHKGERPDLAGKATIPDVLMQAHSAPLNIAFYTGKDFPQEYQGDAFVALHGSWNRGNRTGYKVVRLLFKDGKPTGEYEDFMTGFVVSNGEVWGRPVGVAVANDGALIVTEDGNGTIWRITHGNSHS